VHAPTEPAPEPTPPQGASDGLVGRTIKGRYRVMRLLGRGAMGNVYEVMHERLRSSFALKQLRADLENEPEIVSRFRHEAEIMARLSHPNVARVFDVDAEPDVGSWMAMELVHGEDLGAVMRRAGHLPLAEALRIGIQVATALDCAHRAGLVHRDIKPPNILIEAGTLRAVLTDFGIAKSLVRDVTDSPTRTGVFLGTHRYSSPEQLRNRHDVEIDGRADIYSLGVVLYEMASGKKFLGELSESEVLNAVGFDPAWRAPLAYDDPQPPAALAELIAQCLAPQRDERIGSAGIVAEKLAAIMASLPASSAPPLLVLAATPVVPAEAPSLHVKHERTAATRPPVPPQRRGGIRSASRLPRAVRRRLRWPVLVVLGLMLAAGVAVTLDHRLQALLGIDGPARGAVIQQAQPAAKIVWLTRSEPRWFSVVIDGADPEQPPPMRWYLNDVLVAENTTVWEYDPAQHLQDVTARGTVRFLLGSGRAPQERQVWATRTTVQDLSPVLQSASYKPGSTIEAAVGEGVVIEVDAVDPDDSPLTYTWRIDGKRVGGNTPRLELDAERDATVTLAISDGSAVVSSSWTIAVQPGQP
jgi:serine/threonine protein kinase